MGFLAVDQVVLEMKGVVGLYGGSVWSQVGSLAEVNVCGVVIDCHHHAAGLVELGGLAGSSGLISGLGSGLDIGVMEKIAQAGNLFDVEIVAARALEEFSLCADYEEILIVSVGLDFADLCNQINDCAPG
jgi:hypothetical protein